MIEYVAVTLIVVILSILAFMLGGAFIIALPIWTTIIPLIMFIGMGIILFLYWSDNEKYNPEGKLFIEARKKDVPLLILMHLNGFFKFVVGKKEKKGDLTFKYDKDHKEGIRIDPSIQSGHVPATRTIRNLTTYIMATNSPWSMSIKNVVAYHAVIDHVRKKYPQLEMFSDLVLLEFLKKERAALRPDCENLMQLQDVQFDLPLKEIEAFKGDIRKSIEEELQTAGRTASDEELALMVEEEYSNNKGRLYTEQGAIYLTKLFIHIQDEIRELKLDTHSVHAGKIIEGKFVAFTELFRNISSAWSAADIQTLQQWFEIIGTKKNNLDNMKWIMIFAFAFAVILFGGGLGAYMAGLGK